MAIFSDRLRLLREKNKITLDELADKIVSTKSTLSRYENDKRTPNIEFVERVANFFNVSVDYLLGKTDDPNISVYYSKDMPSNLVDIQEIGLLKDIKISDLTLDELTELTKIISKAKQRKIK